MGNKANFKYLLNKPEKRFVLKCNIPNFILIKNLWENDVLEPGPFGYQNTKSIVNNDYQLLEFNQLEYFMQAIPKKTEGNNI